MTLLVVAPRARRDLIEIGDFIATDNPQRAVTFVEEIIARFDVIAAVPRAFPSRNDLGHGLRLAVHGAYVILYRVSAREVRIESVAHGARDLRRIGLKFR